MLNYFYFRYKIGKNQETFSQMILKKLGLGLMILGLGLNLGGCGWVLVGGGVAAGYKVATDPRSVGIQIDDAKITAKIKMKLIEDKDLKAFSIDVDTVNGVVTLTGVVENEYQKSKAVAIAKSVPGVKTIINNLQIKH
ncbi:BON domain-containing protein [Thermodesulfobacterium hveragerdense]|uniref:BON domain-containing protein n=1 Tax=Thermodesulfobacterium hveragerdense TaxID=53424 RepID=UPI000406F372|nr:BON domain-containing protein [Thermodesulfobacterium hveragerdense]